MREAELQRALTEPRFPDQDFFSPVIGGGLRMQLIVCPSFEEAKAWDITMKPDGWSLFRSRVVQTYPEVLLQGYDLLLFQSDRLKEYFESITSLSLPLTVVGESGGLDDTSFQFAVFSGPGYSWRLHWWEDPLPQWYPLIKIVDDMILAFSGIEIDQY